MNISRKRILFERVCWAILWAITVRAFPRNVASKWEIMLLRLFGAKIGKKCIVYSSARIWLPRNLNMEDGVVIADHVRIQNAEPLYLKAYSTISQYSYVCDGNHQLDNPKISFSESITIGERCWIGAECYISAGVTVGRGCIVGARTVVRSNTPPYSVLLGNPAKVIGFAREPENIIEYEKEIYEQEDRLPNDFICKNYEKYFLNRMKEIKQITRL